MWVQPPRQAHRPLDYATPVKAAQRASCDHAVPAGRQGKGAESRGWGSEVGASWAVGRGVL